MSKRQDKPSDKRSFFDLVGLKNEELDQEEQATISPDFPKLDDDLPTDDVRMENRVDAVAEPMPEPNDQQSEKQTVRLLSKQRYNYSGVEKVVVVNNKRPLRAFLVDPDKVDIANREEQEVDLSEAIEVYNWSTELERMFPDVATVRENALKSFWRAGAFDKRAKTTRVKNDMFNTAFPYKQFLEED